MRSLVVLPTYQEAENIEKVLTLIRQNLPDGSVLVVDDGSPDGTAKLAREAGARLGSVEVMERPAKSGLGTAYRDGFKWGLERGYEAFVEMDADLSHDPAALPSLLAPLGQGYELVIGSRYVPGGSIPDWPWYRWAISRGGNLYAGLMLGIKLTDMTSGFRAYAASLLSRIDLDSVRAESYGFQVEMARRAVLAGAQVKEIPITFTDRTLGRSKMSTFTVVEALVLVTGWGFERLVRRAGLANRKAASIPTSPPGSPAGRI